MSCAPMVGLGALMLALPQARAVGDVAALAPQRVHSDTRTLQAGDCFVALQGERFDAHDFLPQAAAAGAVAALAQRGLAAAGLVGVEVPDSRRALGQLAAAWRAQVYGGPLIAVTGSNGKTTVTQMTAAILRAAAGEAALATQGNLNNDIGLPLTLLRLRPTHRLAVVELGMNHPGETAQLAALAQPTVALINNAQREHQEFMASVQAVAQEHAAVLDALPPAGTAVLPADDAYTALWRQHAAARRVLTFGAQQADVRVLAAQWDGAAWALTLATPAGALHTRLRIAGRHHVRNALAAAACALAAGVQPTAIAQGLAAFEPVAGRCRTQQLRLGAQLCTVVDDSYNANPDSVRAAIDVLAELGAPRWLVLGDMGEVGAAALAFHDEVLRHALARGIEHVWVVGSWFAQAAAAVPAGRVRVFDDAQQAAAALPQQLRGSGGSVLVKGSRFMRMERVVQALQACEDGREGNHAA
ncbi:MAG: UDP-N-acetylmuramoyl-tripeptide--D-alanyl-D-alanine ligase [Tepidimonas sp.]|uniref:UDP-N-acetylmuramoyl-tripeptide--D-alanyl-D- alanine ligase n=1 Tax=Tepidimonas sp. TaxID=2002775 RepID=UPI00298EFF67|nr:UDP-N-acetylmuramoyl-tripeptide--D-alanyl-D-alanine ligase [Tepidimonas sp.]MCS6811892.1 UDP-N-acetylmuramoyl-tripeptide--D-alanyl-D-alanine ligase [Tepidimonas sp.]MDW8336069.1 UDP-N-acetylmuramoyl-tripeptide--D-alanyl-D-alanine ligase [Tepidimonas sp.]